MRDFDSAEALADAYREKSRDVEAAIDKLIKFQAAKASVAGAVTGLGGAAMADCASVTVRLVAPDADGVPPGR